MSEYNVGDTAEAVNGLSRLHGKVVSASNGPGIYDPTGLGTWGIKWLEDQGFTVTVTEKAPLVIPTEPGHYVDKDGDVWTISEADEYPMSKHYAPFTRLETVPETASKVLDRIIEEFGVFHWVEKIAKEFGVEL